MTAVRLELHDDVRHFVYQSRKVGICQSAVEVVQAADLRNTEAPTGETKFALPDGTNVASGTYSCVADLARLASRGRHDHYLCAPWRHNQQRCPRHRRSRHPGGRTRRAGGDDLPRTAPHYERRWWSPLLLSALPPPSAWWANLRCARPEELSADVGAHEEAMRRMRPLIVICLPSRPSPTGQCCQPSGPPTIRTQSSLHRLCARSEHCNVFAAPSLRGETMYEVAGREAKRTDGGLARAPRPSSSGGRPRVISGAGGASTDLLRMQRAIGNRRTDRLQPAAGKPDGDAGPATASTSTNPTTSLISRRSTSST